VSTIYACDVCNLAMNELAASIWVAPSTEFFYVGTFDRDPDRTVHPTTIPAGAHAAKQRSWRKDLCQTCLAKLRKHLGAE
jgi:hypothetical protein